MAEAGNAALEEADGASAAVISGKKAKGKPQVQVPPGGNSEEHKQVLEKRMRMFMELAEQSRKRLHEYVEEFVTITLSDGKVKVGKKGVTSPLDVAAELSSGKVDGTSIAVVNGIPWDMSRPFESDCSLKLYHFDSKEFRDASGFPSSHVLGKEKQPLQRIEVTREQALDIFSENKSKVAIIQQLPEDKKITVYKLGPLVDLYLKPHLPLKTSHDKPVPCHKASASYWRDQADRESGQRDSGFLSGISFPDKKKPKMVVTPDNIYNMQLWKTSGRTVNYNDSVFGYEVEKHEFGPKPMSSPRDSPIFDQRVPSYRELPLRMADFGVLNRSDMSGSLTDLPRARRSQQDDADRFCVDSQTALTLGPSSERPRHLLHGAEDPSLSTRESTRASRSLQPRQETIHTVATRQSTAQEPQRSNQELFRTHWSTLVIPESVAADTSSPFTASPISGQSSVGGDDTRGFAQQITVLEAPGSGVGSSRSISRTCAHCGTNKTPLWRNGPPGPKSLCNACGIRFKKVGKKILSNGGSSSDIPGASPSSPRSGQPKPSKSSGKRRNTQHSGVSRLSWALADGVEVGVPPQPWKRNRLSTPTVQFTGIGRADNNATDSSVSEAEECETAGSSGNSCLTFQNQRPNATLMSFPSDSSQVIVPDVSPDRSPKDAINEPTGCSNQALTEFRPPSRMDVEEEEAREAAFTLMQMSMDFRPPHSLLV